MTFFRTVEREAQERADLQLALNLEGVSLYIHESLVDYFATHSLVLNTRGPRLTIEKDQALLKFERVLLDKLEHKQSEEK